MNFMTAPRWRRYYQNVFSYRFGVFPIICCVVLHCVIMPKVNQHDVLLYVVYYACCAMIYVLVFCRIAAWCVDVRGFVPCCVSLS